jgi:hypothetical protein
VSFLPPKQQHKKIVGPERCCCCWGEPIGNSPKQKQKEKREKKSRLRNGVVSPTKMNHGFLVSLPKAAKVHPQASVHGVAPVTPPLYPT